MFRRTFRHLLAAALLCCALAATTAAATVSPRLAAKLDSFGDAASVGTIIVAFDAPGGLTPAHLDVLRGVGIGGGQTLQKLGMVAVVATAGQARALAAAPGVRSVWSNDSIFLYMNEARVLTGVDRLRADTEMTTRNGGLPVSGKGDFSVLVIDSGVDATHADLQLGSKVIQNVQVLTSTNLLAPEVEFTPLVVAENVPNTDQTVGHGTHCAGIVGGTGVRSGARYAGVAPGSKIIGAGLGAGLFVLNALGAWEWALAHQYDYNIRVVSNSYGSDGPFNPDNPITIASRLAYERNMTILFAGGNAGPGPDTLNPYAKAPWVIGVAAGTKEGGLADFSSRGTPRSQRLANDNPLDDFDAPVITAPGTGRAFESNAGKFTSAIVSTRSTSNITANGLTADAELSPALVPFYTQISGTSMATPFVAGVVALMLDADPTLTPDEIRTILTATASRMPGFEDFEVGAGYVNAYAAVDKVFNRAKPYGSFAAPAFNTQITTTSAAPETFAINYTPQTPGPQSTNTYRFRVAPGIGILDVKIDFGTNLVTDETGNSLGLQLYPPGCLELACGYGSGIALPVLDSPKRQIVVKQPAAGEWIAELRGLRGLAAAGVSSPVGVAVPERVDGTIIRSTVTPETIADIQGHAAQAQIEEALFNRRIDSFSDNTFRPDALVTREEFARSLFLNTPVRQTLGATQRFTDVTGSFAALAEAVTAQGSNLRDYDFVPGGMMSASGAQFAPAGSINRIDLAVAFVRALGLDVEARSKANTIVTFDGQPLSDNAQIPAAMRGYVQLAIDRGLLEVYPAEVRQMPGGGFVALPGPRVEPLATATRAALAAKLNAFAARFAAGN